MDISRDPEVAGITGRDLGLGALEPSAGGRAGQRSRLACWDGHLLHRCGSNRVGMGHLLLVVVITGAH